PSTGRAVRDWYHGAWRWTRPVLQIQFFLTKWVWREDDAAPLSGKLGMWSSDVTALRALRLRSRSPRARPMGLSRRDLNTLLCAPRLGGGGAAFGQQPGKVARVGYLTRASAGEPSHVLFRMGLEELGYFQGRNVWLLEKFADGDDERLPTLAAELVRDNVDV